MTQVQSFYISNIENKLAYFEKTLSTNDLQELVTSATFLSESNNESDVDSEKLQINSDEEINESDNEFAVSKKGQDIESADEDMSDNLDLSDNLDMSNNLDNEEDIDNEEDVDFVSVSDSENLPIALRKAC
ncbi:1609_t:CDS:2, partial [Scutellospora calospora]